MRRSRAKPRRTGTGIASKSTKRRKKGGHAGNGSRERQFSSPFVEFFSIFAANPFRGSVPHAKPRSRKAAKGDRRKKNDVKGRPSVWRCVSHAGFRHLKRSRAKPRRTGTGIASKSTKRRKKGDHAGNGSDEHQFSSPFVEFFSIFAANPLRGSVPHAKPRSRKAAKGDRRKQGAAKGSPACGDA